jgi:hypothetical protein
MLLQQLPDEGDTRLMAITGKTRCESVLCTVVLLHLTET